MVKKMHPMQSMELDDEDQMEAIQPYPMSDRPKYPYGLCISLTHKELEKLNVDPSEAVVGGIIHLHAMARITSVSASDSQASQYSDGGPQCRIELQIEDMMVESEDEENTDD